MPKCQRQHLQRRHQPLTHCALHRPPTHPQAQRVPDDHVGVVTNGLSVREVDFADEHAFLSSANLRPIAKAHGWWTEGQPFDFTKIFGAPGMGAQYYVGRRMWSAYKLLAPNQAFPSHYSDFIDDAPYPATAMTTKKVGLQDVMRVMRDYYQNTSFDMTKGVAAGQPHAAAPPAHTPPVVTTPSGNNTPLIYIHRPPYGSTCRV